MSTGCRQSHHVTPPEAIITGDPTPSVKKRRLTSSFLHKEAHTKNVLTGPRVEDDCFSTNRPPQKSLSSRGAVSLSHKIRPDGLQAKKTHQGEKKNLSRAC